MLNEPPSFQTLTTLRGLLDAAGLTPRKLYGQHFLIDGNLMNKLVAAAELNPSDTVLEVGTGTGSLTTLLARSAGQVVTVEIDAQIASVADDVLAPMKNVRQILGDALKNKSTISPDVICALREAMASRCGNLKLVANLPYDIATSLVIDLLLSELPFERLCFTVQTEVADRFAAVPDTGAYGAVGIIAQSLAKVRRICKVPPEAFWPRPRVDSSMLCLVPLPASMRPVADATRYAHFVRRFFLHRRKTMSHLLRGEEQSERLLAGLDELKIDRRSRPEQLSTSQWQALFSYAC